MLSVEPFAKLFRKYRLRSEFETLSELGDTLADYNFIYENSIFSHWQKGTRIPKDRNLVLTLIKIFCQRGGITSIKEANSVMASTGLGYLTDEELSDMPLTNKRKCPFQAPRKKEHFIGRDEVIGKVQDLLNQNKIVFLYGQPGVGKTALATEIAHISRENYPDGVLWCSFDSSSPLSVLHKIAQAYDEILPINATLEEASSLYRSFISTKKALFIFDNILSDTPLNLMLPNSSHSSVLITTVSNEKKFADYGTCIKVEAFSETEVQELYTSILTSNELKANKKDLDELKNIVGGLPLALQLLTKQLSHRSLSLKNILREMKNSNKLNDYLHYENKSLSSSFALCYDQLDRRTQKVLSSCVLFEGSHFSPVSLAAIHSLSESRISTIIDSLISYSLIEECYTKRYRLHPLFHLFLKEKPQDIEFIKNLINFYIEFIRTNQNKSNFFTLMANEVYAIKGILERAIQHSLINEACELWQLFGSYYWHVGSWRDFKDISVKMYKIAKDYHKRELELSICLEEVSRLYYYDGNVKSALLRAKESLDIANDIDNTFMKSLAHQRYGKLCFMNSLIEEGIQNLKISERGFQTLKDKEYLSHNYRYSSEAEVIKKNYAYARELLQKSLNEIKNVKNKTREVIYTSVIYSHIGTIDYLEKNYEAAKESFTKGLHSEAKYPLVRGTYTWLNRLGLALTFQKLKYNEEAKDLLSKARNQMKLLGIEKSFKHINVFAATLQKEIAAY